MRKVVIAGGTGFLGQHLVTLLRAKSWEAHVLQRGREDWNGRDRGAWESRLEGADAVINLCGAPVTLPWNAKNRALILDSRVQPTVAIGRALDDIDEPPKVWINASATGFYGNRGDELLTESSGHGVGFLAEVCDSWESSFSSALPPSVRGVALRTGVVLGQGGGALEPMSRLARFGLGGTVGNGRQWMPWIHIMDHLLLVLHALDSDWSGPLNAVSPNPVTNQIFMESVRKAVRCPIGIPAPAFGLEIVSKVGGPDPHILLDSTRVVPQKAIDTGFEFNFPNLPAALAALLGRARAEVR